MKRNYFADFMSVIYPSICVGCGNQIQNREEQICFSCVQQLPYTNESIHQNLLNEKLMALADISGSYALCYYNSNSVLQDLMKQLKYRNQPQIGVVFGRLLGEKLLLQQIELDCVVPVPLHPKKMRKRRYNQAYEIAKGVGEVLNIEVENNLIVRTKHNATQTNRGKLDRFENVEQIFSAKNQIDVQEKSILVVDDVITTGATILSCASVLLALEAKKVYVAAVGKADTLG